MKGKEERREELKRKDDERKKEEEKGDKGAKKPKSNMLYKITSNTEVIDSSAILKDLNLDYGSRIEDTIKQ